MIAPQLYGVILHDRGCFPDLTSLLQAGCLVPSGERVSWGTEHTMKKVSVHAWASRVA